MKNKWTHRFLVNRHLVYLICVLHFHHPQLCSQARERKLITYWKWSTNRRKWNTNYPCTLLHRTVQFYSPRPTPHTREYQPIHIRIVQFHHSRPIPQHKYRLVGLVVKASTLRAQDSRFESRLRRDFSGVESYQWLKLGTPVATLPGAWCYTVSAGTGWLGVSILWLGEMESLFCNFYLSVAACKIVWAGPSLRNTCMLLGC